MIEGDGHDEGPGPDRPPGEAALLAQVVQVGDHRRRVERSAVVEAHALAQRERPRAAVGGGPARGEGGFGAAAVGAVAHERLAHVGHDRRRHEVGGAVRVEGDGVGRETHDQRVRGRGEQGEEEESVHAESAARTCATSRPA